MQTEVFLIQTKRKAEDTTQPYVRSLVALLGCRIVRLRADRGTDYAGSAFPENCRRKAMQLEFAATNTPSQIDVSERIGRILAGMPRSHLLDRGLPWCLRGELMLTLQQVGEFSSGHGDPLQETLRQNGRLEASQDNRHEIFRPHRDRHQDARQERLRRPGLRLARNPRIIAFTTRKRAR